jgi:hypothetical protein
MRFGSVEDNEWPRLGFFPSSFQLDYMLNIFELWSCVVYTVIMVTYCFIRLFHMSRLDGTGGLKNYGIIEFDLKSHVGCFMIMWGYNVTRKNDCWVSFFFT